MYELLTIYTVKQQNKIMKTTNYLFIFLLVAGAIKASQDTGTGVTNADQAENISDRAVPQIAYQQFGPDHYNFFSKQAPGFNTGDKDNRFNGIKPIVFTPATDSTGQSSQQDLDENIIGYFWNIPQEKNSDPSAMYSGKAKIGNDEYIDAVAVRHDKVNQTGTSDDVAFTDVEDIYHVSPEDKAKFDPDFLTNIGSFVRKGVLFDLYARYEYTLTPDSETVESI